MARSKHKWRRSKSVRTGNSPQTKSTNTPYKYAKPPAPLSPPRMASPPKVGRTSVRLFLSLRFLRLYSSPHSHTLHQPHQIPRQRPKLRPRHGTIPMNHNVLSHGHLQPMEQYDL